MPRTIRLNPLDSASVEQAIRELESYKQWMLQKQEELVSRLADVGLQVARVRFAGAKYAGINDVTCRVEKNGTGATIFADGDAVAFIEFGTGVSHPAYPPGTDYTPPPHGSYGQGKGRRKKWGYYGDPGNIGEVKVNTAGQEVVITSGNDPALAMWTAVVQMSEEVAQIAREVFSR